MITEPHILHRIYDNENVDGTIFSMTPSCSCGWKGVTFTSNDIGQIAAVMKQEQEHLRKVMYQRGFELAKEYMEKAKEQHFSSSEANQALLDGFRDGFLTGMLS